MSRPKDILLLGLALFSGALAILALWQRQEIRRLRIALHAERPVRPSLAMHSASKERITVPHRRHARGARAEAEVDERETGTADPAWSNEGRFAKGWGRRSTGLVRLMENPEFVQALGLQRHAMLDARFAQLFRALNLAPEELAKFKSLLVEKENVALDVVTVSEALPDGPLGPETLQASLRAAQAQVEQAILSSLGGERYAMYQDYERTLAQRATVAQLEQRLSYTDTPLAPGQADALVRILAEHAPPTPVEQPPVISVLVRAGVPEAVPILPTNAATGRVTDQVVSQSQTVLAPPQIEALRELQTEQQAAVRAAELIRQASPNIDLPAVGVVPYLY